MTTVEETRAETVRRRLRTIPRLVLGFVVATPLLPLLLAAALLIDGFRLISSRIAPTAARLTLCVWFYLAAEVVGLVALAALWVASLGGRRRVWLVEMTWRAKLVWARLLFGAVRALFGLRLEVEGGDAVAPGPVIVLVRHTSVVDTLLPERLIVGPHAIRLRYVMMRELLADPCLDVAGGWLGFCFVRRGSGDERELRRVGALAERLGSNEGVLIYPEGARFTREGRKRAIGRLRASDPRLAGRAERLRHLLPPHPGGVSALLDAAPDADVLVVAHRGLEGLRRVPDLWSGGLVGRAVAVRITRLARSSVPPAGPQRLDWLYGVWEEMDRWLERGAAGPAP